MAQTQNAPPVLYPLPFSVASVQALMDPRLNQYTRLPQQQASGVRIRSSTETLDSSNDVSDGSHEDPRGSLTYFNGLALVVGLQIGSGIFSAPSQVSNHVPSPGAAVLVWLVAGVLVWTGAASFVELGLAIPRNGGIQEYLRVCYGDFWGFLFSWMWLAVVKPCGMAMITMIFAENVTSVIMSDELLSPWKLKIVALTGISLITSLNCLGSRLGPQAANGFLILKLFAITSIVATGAIIAYLGTGQGVAKSDLGWFGSDPDPDRQGLQPWNQIGEYVSAVYGALFCYGGWELIGFVAGEMVNPLRDLPRVIKTSMNIAIGGFVMMNIALFVVLPFKAVRERSIVAAVGFVVLSRCSYSLSY